MCIDIKIHQVCDITTANGVVMLCLGTYYQFSKDFIKVVNIVIRGIESAQHNSVTEELILEVNNDSGMVAKAQ